MDLDLVTVGDDQWEWDPVDAEEVGEQVEEVIGTLDDMEIWE